MSFKFVSLVLLFLLCTMGSWMVYGELIKGQALYICIGTLLGVGMSVLWYYVAFHCNTKLEIYKYSFVYDAVIALTYAIIPIIFFTMKLDGKIALGGMFVIIGVFLLK